MKLKVASETYQDEAKLRISAVTVAPPNFVAEGKVRCGGRAGDWQRGGKGQPAGQPLLAGCGAHLHRRPPHQCNAWVPHPPCRPCWT
jgi:hypothetical protein